MAFNKAAVSFISLETLLEMLKQSSTDRDIVCVPHYHFTAVKLEQVRDLLPQIKP